MLVAEGCFLKICTDADIVLSCSKSCTCVIVLKTDCEHPARKVMPVFAWVLCMYIWTLDWYKFTAPCKIKVQITKVDIGNMGTFMCGIL